MNKQILDTINAIPIWTSNIKINKSDGGMTKKFLVEDDKSKYVVRLGSDIPKHLVSRSNEVIASKAASRCGISPNVKYPNLGILILEFIESKTLTYKDIK